MLKRKMRSVIVLYSKTNLGVSRRMKKMANKAADKPLLEIYPHKIN